VAAKGCRCRPLFDIPRRQTAFRVPPIATGPISSAASGCRSPPPIATGRLFSAASPPAGSGAPVHPTSLSRYPASGVLRGLVGPAQPRLPPSPTACRPQDKDAWRERCECRLPDASRRRIGRPGARMGRGWDAWRGGYARGADGTTWDPGAHMGWGHARGRVLRDPEARTNLGLGVLRNPEARTDLGWGTLRNPGERTDSGGPERCTPREG
jgi:hypothetical protein